MKGDEGSYEGNVIWLGIWLCEGEFLERFVERQTKG